MFPKPPSLLPELPSSGPQGTRWSFCLLPDSSLMVQARHLIRVLVVSLGFFLSAGWDWILPLHPFWTASCLHSRSWQHLDEILYEQAIVCFVYLCVLLLSGFLLEKVARLPFSRKLSFVLIQTIMASFLLLLEFNAGGEQSCVGPGIIATTTMGVIWLTALTRLSTVLCCFGYGVICCLGLIAHEFLGALSPQTLLVLRLLSPFIALPLLIPAFAHIDDSFPEPASPPEPLVIPSDLAKGVWIALCVIAVVCTLQILHVYSRQISGIVPSWEEWPLTMPGRVFPGMAAGAFFTATLLAFRPQYPMVAPLVALLCFGLGVFLSITLSHNENTIHTLLYMAAGMGSTFALAMLNLHSRSRGPTFLASAWSLFSLYVMGIVVTSGTWILAFNTQFMQKGPYAQYNYAVIFLVLLTILALHIAQRPLENFFNIAKPEVVSEAVLPEPEPAIAAPMETAMTESLYTQLTAREREIAELVQVGMKNLEISYRLNITEATLRVHLRRIYRKLGIQGRQTLRAYKQYNATSTSDKSFMSGTKDNTQSELADKTLSGTRQRPVASDANAPASFL